MPNSAVVFLVIALITGVIAVASVPAAEAAVAKILFFVYLAVIPIFLVRERRAPTAAL